MRKLKTPSEEGLSLSLIVVRSWSQEIKLRCGFWRSSDTAGSLFQRSQESVALLSDGRQTPLASLRVLEDSQNLPFPASHQQLLLSSLPDPAQSGESGPTPLA